MSGMSSVRAVVADALDTVAEPEHTGENRCLPCTLVNAVVVAVAAALLFRRRRSLGLLAAAVGAAAIWLRGYVLPGTPRFAPRLVEPLPVDIGPDHDLGSDSLAAAGANSLRDDRPDVTDARSEPDPSSGDGDPAANDRDADGVDDRDPAAAVDSDGVGGSTETDPEATMATLIDADALAADEETLALDESFRAALYDRIGALREASDEELAERAAAISGPDVEGQVHDGRVLLAGSRDAWVSRPIALAETAAAEVLRERGVDDAVARQAARPLRAFLDTCPVCEGPVRETTLRNCCGGPGGVSGNPERPVRACADCDAIVFADRS
ncbi:hypothetical protein [Halorubrum lipolyticum]|uniref:Uncharacterized protein n=1 Tax=Halorubrum lipolyticum DSM 21995 TaxID=1227482 RepID=M0NIY3_9EURY|nr:hypothetical protein [Halorubrum lipolyticum]EMA57034.1 hypothetical protein C469_14908 [Halorubrum lipolyticum DSM 21995]